MKNVSALRLAHEATAGKYRYPKRLQLSLEPVPRHSVQAGEVVVRLLSHTGGEGTQFPGFKMLGVNEENEVVVLLDFSSYLLADKHTYIGQLVRVTHVHQSHQDQLHFNPAIRHAYTITSASVLTVENAEVVLPELRRLEVPQLTTHDMLGRFRHNAVGIVYFLRSENNQDNGLCSIIDNYGAHAHLHNAVPITMSFARKPAAFAGLVREHIGQAGVLQRTLLFLDLTYMAAGGVDRGVEVGPETAILRLAADSPVLQLVAPDIPRSQLRPALPDFAGAVDGIFVPESDAPFVKMCATCNMGLEVEAASTCADHPDAGYEVALAGTVFCTTAAPFDYMEVSITAEIGNKLFGEAGHPVDFTMLVHDAPADAMQVLRRVQKRFQVDAGVVTAFM